MQNVSTEYSDFTYKLSGRKRPSPRLASLELFTTHDNSTLPPSYNNLTAMFAFFGKLRRINFIIN